MALVEKFLQNLVSSPTACLALLLLALLAVLLQRALKQLRAMPPGPWGYPVLGIVPFIKKEFHLFLTDYAQQFGKIYSCRMGQQNLLVLSDHKVIKRVLQSKEFTARPKSDLMSILSGYGIINSDGKLWKDQRRFLLKQQMGAKSSLHSAAGGLRSASGVRALESRIQREVSELVRRIAHDHDGRAVDPAPLVQCAAANVVASMVFSARFRHDDARFRRFMHLFDEGFRLFVDTGLYCFIPALGHLPGVRDTVRKLTANRDEMAAFVREVVRDHEATLDADHPRDLVDAYLIKNRELSAEGRTDEHYHGFGADRQLEQIVLDLFSAGVETVSSTLLWCLAYMMHNPAELEKVKAELRSVVGENRLPELEDMKSLPYTRAVIYETMRKSSIVPMGVSHATVGTSTIEGYTVPDNTHIVPLLHAVHHDPEEWPEPEAFRPARFLSADGAEVVKPAAFMPFSAGQRQCMGDQLAEKELFLLFASLVHCFDVSPADAAALPGLRGLAGATVKPPQFSLRFSRPNVEAIVDGMRRADERKDDAQHVRIYG